MKHVDYFFNKLLPKKFIVFVIATIIVLSKIEAPQEYWYVLMAYLGINGIQKFSGITNKEKEK